MIRAVIFDMDGVLVDSEPLHLVSTNRVLAPHGAHLTAAQNKAYLGWTEAAFWQDLIRRFHLPGTPSQYIAARRRQLLSLFESQMPVASGIEVFLQTLRSLALRLAVASSSDAEIIRHVLRSADLAVYFDTVTAGDEITRSKPDPEIFLVTAQRLGVQGSECLVFEDSPSGILAALAAGMRCVRVVTETTRDVQCPVTFREIESFERLDPRELLS